MERILIYGGAFDPPHLGHERLLKAAIEQVAPDLTLVIPTGKPPHKGGPSASFAARAQMARVFLNGQGNIKISGLENQTKRRKNYMIETLKRVQKKYSGARLYLLVGGDMLLGFARWRSHRRILSMVTLVAADRGEEEKMLAQAKRDLEGLGGQVELLAIQPLAVSSTEIRARLGRGESVAGLVSEPVAKIIAQWGLYR